MYHIAAVRDKNTMTIDGHQMKRNALVPYIALLMPLLSTFVPAAGAEDKIPPAIFPEPKELVATGGAFELNEKVVIALPAKPSELDLQLATMLANELGDRFDIHPARVRMPALAPGKRIIAHGDGGKFPGS